MDDIARRVSDEKFIAKRIAMKNTEKVPGLLTISLPGGLLK
jgi:hypothetical protein